MRNPSRLKHDWEITNEFGSDICFSTYIEGSTASSYGQITLFETLKLFKSPVSFAIICEKIEGIILDSQVGQDHRGQINRQVKTVSVKVRNQ